MVAPGPDLGVEGYENAVEVGRGGFARVYRAWQPGFERYVAIKVIAAPDVDEDTLSRFRRECQAIGSLSGHPNIVTVYEHGRALDGRPYIVMEFLSGGSLAGWIDQRGAMSWQKALDVGVKLAGALESAHRAGVLHRDLKPENALVSRYGEPKLADFGIARIEGKTATRTGVVTGTVAHAPPEVLSGARPTVASDVYSLGSTLFTLLAGHPAFLRPDDESLIAVVARVASEPVPDLRAGGVPGDVAAVIEQTMAKQPFDRHASAAALGRAFQAAQAASGLAVTALPIETGPDETGAQPAVTAGSGPLGLELPTAGPTIVPVPTPGGHATEEVAATSTFPPPPPSAVPPAPAPERHGRPRWLVAVGLLVVLGLAGVVAIVAKGGSGGSGQVARPGEAVAKTFASLLAQNDGARQQVVNAVGGVSKCTLDPGQGEAGLDAAINTRVGILDKLAKLDPAPLPEGGQLRSVLQLAMQASVEADRHYVDWMRYVASAGCGPAGAPLNDAFAAADASSANAGSAKASFVSAWNQVAGRFRLRTVSEDQL